MKSCPGFAVCSVTGAVDSCWTLFHFMFNNPFYCWLPFYDQCHCCCNKVTAVVTSASLAVSCHLPRQNQLLAAVVRTALAVGYLNQR